MEALNEEEVEKLRTKIVATENAWEKGFITAVDRGNVYLDLLVKLLKED